ncbi:O-antigen ligase [Rhodonellum sp.]|uniref:O-antigen ligase family protein n=1 Tax=Rhodonellum sp. TaxID=2231180 RepID=UPI002727BA68|nr:O-antigen ligase family protein [Rhodonellum sp.]MDO9553523.1 O-antigen ligase family protein [Rhodonellum sp.]
MAIVFGLLVAKAQFIGIGLIFIIIPLLIVMYFIFQYPLFGLFLAFNLAFVGNGLSRYIPIPFGLLLDAVIFVSVFLSLVKSDPSGRQSLNSAPFYVFFVWFVYTTLQVLNPQAVSLTAWFYAVRGTSFNFLFIIIICLIYLKDKKHLEIFLYTWLAWSVLAVLWGLKQKMIGLDGAENAWLAAGNASTHILHGKLRVFSFFSDAGQFGASMAQAALVFAIIAIGPGSKTKKILFGLGGLLCLYGMLISGTRGALIVPAGGGFVYLLVNKNFKVLILGAIVAASAFGVLKYTYIGQGNYDIQRLRSALDPEDASLNVRKDNQKIFAKYLADKPFGGGIGSAGYFGLRFSPDTLLANTPTDSWYVRIWAETGIVGLIIHVAGILIILGLGFFKIFNIDDPGLRNTMGALLAGLTGIVLASYGNSIIGQYPSNIICFISIPLIWKAYLWDTKPDEPQDQTKASHSS